MKKLLIVLALAAIVSSCKKESTTKIHAAAWIADYPLPREQTRVLANIAFIKGDASSIVKDAETVDAYFKTNPPNSATTVQSYEEYVEDGEYTILIQKSNNPPLQDMYKTFSYKIVSVRNGQPTEGGLMLFNHSPKGYQPWNDKY